ncbi:MAG: recombinase RecA [bacterium]
MNEELIRSLERSFGRGILMSADGNPQPDVEVIPTGSFALDRALGIGGVPKGRIIEIYGPEASGKTTLALSIIAQAQKQGAVAAFVDAEHALDLRYARHLGVDCARMLLSQPDCGEQAMDVVEALVRSGQVNVVVVDSVAALVPKAEIDGEAGSGATGLDVHVGLQARLMSRAMRKLASLAHQTGTTLIFINQIRMKIGVTMGSSETPTGGNALRFYASVRIDVRRLGSLKKDDNVYGNRLKVKVVKNKMAPPFREVEIDLLFGSGFCREGEVFDLAVAQGAISRAGDELVGQGRERAIAELKARPDLCARVEALLAPPEAGCEW